MKADTPEDVIEQFTVALNGGNVDGAMELYEPAATLGARPGEEVMGREAIRAALDVFVALEAANARRDHQRPDRRRRGTCQEPLAAGGHDARRSVCRTARPQCRRPSTQPGRQLANRDRRPLGWRRLREPVPRGVGPGVRCEDLLLLGLELLFARIPCVFSWASCWSSAVVRLGRHGSLLEALLHRGCLLPDVLGVLLPVLALLASCHPARYGGCGPGDDGRARRHADEPRTSAERTSGHHLRCGCEHVLPRRLDDVVSDAVEVEEDAAGISHRLSDLASPDVLPDEEAGRGVRLELLPGGLEVVSLNSPPTSMFSLSSAACTSGSSSVSSNATTSPDSLFPTNAASIRRIVFDSTSSPRAGTTSPRNLLPGKATIA